MGPLGTTYFGKLLLFSDVQGFIGAAWDRL
jgi:hypothetical protein